MRIINKMLVGACALTSCLVCAEEKSTYQVTSSVDNGINLNSLGDSYYHDRLAGPNSGEVTVTGTIQHSAADGEPFTFVGKGGRLILLNSGLLSADGQLTNPLIISGLSAGDSAPALDFRDGKIVLGADWAKWLKFNASNQAQVQFAEFTLTDKSGTPLLFNPSGSIYVSRFANAGVIRLGQDGGRVTADFNSIFGCWSGDNINAYNDNRYTAVHLGGSSVVGGAPGYVNVTYHKQEFTGVIYFSDNVTASTSLQASQGLTNTITITGTGGNILVPNFYRYGPESCLIRFDYNYEPRIWQPGWHGELFHKENDNNDEGRYVLESVNGSKVFIRISVGSIGTSSVVEFRGAGDVRISLGDTLEAPDANKNYRPAKLYNPNGSKIIWNHTGELTLNNHAVITGDNALPYGPGKGGVCSDSNWLTVDGNQRLNSFYGGATVCNISANMVTFTIGENDGACQYDIVAAPATATKVGKQTNGQLLTQTNMGWLLKKVGSGILTLKKPPFKTLQITEGDVSVVNDMTIQELEFMEGTKIYISGATVSLPNVIYSSNNSIVLSQAGVLVLGEGDQDVTFDCSRLVGDATCTLRKIGNGTLTLVGNTQQFSGTLDVVEGKAVFADNFQLSRTITQVNVSAGAELSIPSGINIKTFTAIIGDNQCEVNKKYSGVAGDDVTVVSGLTGTGTLSILPSSGIWTGSVNDEPDNAGNWKDFIFSPDVQCGGFNATFADGDNNGMLNITQQIAFRSLIITENLTSFKFGDSDQSGSLSIGLDGFSATTDRTENNALKVYVGVPLIAQAKSYWHWGANSVLNLTGPLQGEGSIYKGGAGTWYFYGENATHSGDMVISNGNIHVYGNEPLGTNGTLTLKVKEGKTDSNGNGVNLYLHNATISKNIVRYDDGWNNRRGIYSVGGTTNEIRGYLSDGTCPQLIVENNSTLILSGGYTCDYMNWGVSGTIIITNRPITIGTAECSCYNMIIYCSGNKMDHYASWGSRPYSAATGGFDIRVDEPITFTGSISELCINGYIKLNGHNWTVSSLGTTSGTYITSDTPATLTVNQSIAGYCTQGRFEKAVNLVKKGVETLNLAGNSTSTGSVSVVEGTLYFTNTASWVGASMVSVTQTGNLEVENCEVFGNKNRAFPLADVYLSGDGTYTFATGVTGLQRIGYLYLDDSEKSMPSGAYGSLENTSVPQSHRTSHIKGSGVLYVVGSGQGCVLILR